MTTWTVQLGHSWYTITAERFEVTNGYLWFYGVEDDEDAEVGCFRPGWTLVQRDAKP